MPELHCSTCDTTITAGAACCPGCGLQLTTTAQPAVYVEKARWPLWPIALGAIFLFFLIAHEVDREGAVKASDAKETFASDWAAGKLNSVDAFTARCGRPLVISTGPDAAQDLRYNSGEAGDYVVTLGSDPRLELERLHGRQVSRTRVWPEMLFAQLHCK